MKILAAMTATACLLLTGVVFAHEGENHQEMHKGSGQMAKLHKMMPVYARSQAKINEALEKRDAATVAKETGKILATIPDLKKATPHKNVRELKAMRKIASAFEGNVRETAELAKKKDFTGARVAFENAQKRCNECHVKFRD
jgi:aldehyde:ferredoxin oxidoreductase